MYHMRQHFVGRLELSSGGGSKLITSTDKAHRPDGPDRRPRRPTPGGKGFEPTEKKQRQSVHKLGGQHTR